MSNRDCANAERLERLERLYELQLLAHDAIVSVRPRVALYEQICRMLVEQGRMTGAWIGEPDDDGQITAVANAGAAEIPASALVDCALDDSHPQAPTVIAVREHRHIVVDDTATDERMARWREAALERGYRSAISLPLIVEGRCVAALTAYASTPSFFDDVEVRTLDRLASDLSFALAAIEREERGRSLEDP